MSTDAGKTDALRVLTNTQDTNAITRAKSTYKAKQLNFHFLYTPLQV